MTQEIAKKRTRKRASINGVRNVLTVQGKDAAFEYRVVNDNGDRVATFEENGWEVETSPDVKIGERRINNPTTKGSPVSINVGQGMKGVLMKIPNEFYKEDQEVKAENIAKMEQDMKSRSKEGFYGKLEVKT